MKILYRNYLKDSTLIASFEDTQYPIANVYHKFLEKVYKSGNPSTTITIEFPENRTVSAIAIGFTNIIDIESPELRLSQSASDVIQLDQSATDVYKLRIDEGVDFELQNASGSTLFTGALDLNYDEDMTYFEPVVCRRVILKAVTLQADMYIGGLSVGDPIEYEYHDINPSLPINPRGSAERTDGGQVLGKKNTALRSWSATVPLIDTEKRKETIEMANEVGIYDPVYADIYDLNHEEEAPLYGTLTDLGIFERDTNTLSYTMSIAVLEAR